MQKIILIFFLAFLIFLMSASSYSVQLTLSLNSTQVEWEEAINASGYASSAGSAWIGNVSVKLNGKEVCRTKSDSTGFYNCSFFSPSQIGNFLVSSHALNDSTIVGKSDEILLSVIYFYGSKKPTKNVVALDFPLLIQDLNGKIHRIRAYLKVWS